MAKWGYAKKPLYVLSAVALIDQIDASIIRGVLPYIQKEFRLSDFALGSLASAFVFVNAIATIPAGWVADRYKRTTIVGWTMLSWSALSGLSALAFNFPSLFLSRAALGIGQAVDDPSSTSLLSDYYPAQMRGRVFSWQQVSVFLGGAIGIGVGGFVGAQFGWRWAFALVGMPGSAIAYFCFRLQEPARGLLEGAAKLPAAGTIEGLAAATATPVVEARADGPTAGMSIADFTREAARSLVAEMKMIFGIRTMRYVLIGVGILLFTVSGVGSWLTIYHDRYSGMSPGEAAGLTAVTLGLSGIIGTLWGGQFADKLHAGGPIGRIRLVSNAILVCAVTFFLSLMVPIVPLRIALQFAGVLAIASAFPALRASMMDVVPAESRGVSASAFALVSTVFGTALAPPLIGLISDLSGSLVAAFYLVTPPILVGSLILRRAQHTIVEDAQAIITKMMERQQASSTPSSPT
ncbi:MAG: MFS transporter [Actinomycetota bacterium]|nr:MFS transporter [Actinomycetota bacterium]